MIRVNPLMPTQVARHFEHRTPQYMANMANAGSKAGSAVIELALLIPLLMLVLTGTVELSRVFHTATAVTNAARAGVQFALSNPTNNAANYAGMQTAATNDGSGISGLTANASQFCQCSDGTSTPCGSSGCGIRTYVKVVTSATFSTIGTYPFVPSSIIINSQASARVN